MIKESHMQIGGFIPATKSQVCNMNMEECKEYLAEIVEVLTDLRTRKREFLLQNNGREHYHYVERTVKEMNLERARVVQHYRVAQKRLEYLGQQRHQDAIREVDHWLYLFHREAKKVLDPAVYRKTVETVCDIIPLPKKLEGAVTL